MEVQGTQAETHAEFDLNSYEGIAKYYDELMTNGYYDYGEICGALHQILGERTKVIELGVGTGLVAEGLLSLSKDYCLTGVDNTASMLEQARERLGDQIEYEMQDITTLSLEHKFEAAFSVGGCWYFIDNGTSLDLCSHIDDPAACRLGLVRVIEQLEEGGLLTFALQGVHANYSTELDDGLVYSQEIFLEEGGFTKRYHFERAGETVAEQVYRYLLMPSDKVSAFFAELGCEAVGLDQSGTFFSYRKCAKASSGQGLV